MTPPKVTTLIPIYNTPEVWLRTAIRTAALQSHPNIDVILSDNGSRASTIEVLKQAQERWPDRIILTSEREKKGTAYALDAALKVSDKDTVYFTKLDSDDLCHKDREKNRVALFEKLPPQIGGIYDNFMMLNYLPRPHIQPIILRPYDYRSHTEDSYIHGNAMWRASVFDEGVPRTFVYDGYDNPKANFHAEDYAFWLQIGDRFDFFLMNCDPAMSWTYRFTGRSKYSSDRRGVDYSRALVQHAAKERRGLLSHTSQ